ncbi:hypothetical protein O1611_g9010 [Lasiodiplodia mahajangana]|uniref:Uncharacterized protein n=1 Tax=Lasiodiplodia mahajangana TaxID=1108764 RepID=A0ACC2JB65_9PEZI|nr:hypothetical protein O1611_g9010 [Lasiodiplodia mahajangana]
MGHLSNDETCASHAVPIYSVLRNSKADEIPTLVSYDQPLPEASDEAVLPDLHPPRPVPILIRATNSKGKEARTAKEKVKLSTVVEPDALPAFFERYAEICKLGMGSLKPRDRSKRKGKAKKKSKAAATTA